MHAISSCEPVQARFNVLLDNISSCFLLLLNYFILFHVVLIFISLKTKEIEQLCVCLSAYVSSSVKCLFGSFSCFSILIVFSYWFMGILFIFLITNSLSQICVAFIFQFRFFFKCMILIILFCCCLLFLLSLSYFLFLF